MDCRACKFSFSFLTQRHLKNYYESNMASETSCKPKPILIITAIGIDFESNDSPFDRFLLVATGRLRQGRLHGFVVINGIISNDPKSHCQNSILQGIGFIGHYKDGIPHGVCWRGLTGGAWIHGEVNEEGYFTGIKTTFN